MNSIINCSMVVMVVIVVLTPMASLVVKWFAFDTIIASVHVGPAKG